MRRGEKKRAPVFWPGKHGWTETTAGLPGDRLPCSGIGSGIPGVGGGGGGGEIYRFTFGRSLDFQRVHGPSRTLLLLSPPLLPADGSPGPNAVGRSVTNGALNHAAGRPAVSRDDAVAGNEWGRRRRPVDSSAAIEIPQIFVRSANDVRTGKTNPRSLPIMTVRVDHDSFSYFFRATKQHFFVNCFYFFNYLLALCN